MRTVTTQASAPILALAFASLVFLSGCSGQGTGFFDISAADTFAEALAKFQAQGYDAQERDERPYIFTPDDFERYYTFTDNAPLLASLKKEYNHLLSLAPMYSMRESVFLDTYLLRRPLDDAEAGISFSAFDGSLLYAYCFIPDILPVLDHYRANYDVKGPFFVNEDEGGYSFWYLEAGGEAMLIDTGNDPTVDPSGGVVVFYADNIKEFYAQMRDQLTPQTP